MHYPNFHYERTVWKKDYKFVAGVDEVGRGALAGPVVAACVVYKRNSKFNKPDVKIDDSKKLTKRTREKAGFWIRENALTWGMGEVSSRDIDKFGIVKATNKAIRMALGQANQRFQNKIDYLLIDAFYIPYIKGIRMGKKTKKIKARKRIKFRPKRRYGQQLAIVKGDEKSISIASASIIAKVYRDNLMTGLSKRNRYKKYLWDKNKGYGTRVHRKAIERYGTTLKHRLSFL